MAFIKKIWKDRISEFPNRRTINDGNVTKQVTVGRDEGAITEAGDSFDAANMNDLEQRIEDAYGDVAALVADEVANQYDSSNVIFDDEPDENHGTGYTVTSKGIKEAIDSGLVHTKTASGSLVHIEDGADNIPVKSLASEIVAVESGNGQPKSPTNPYTISGFDNGVVSVCGKNMFNSALEQGTINSTTGGINPSTTRCVNTDLIPIPQGVSRLSSNKNIYEVAYFDKAKNFVRTAYFNTSVAVLNTSYAYFRISIRNVDNSTILPSDITVQLELGNQATTYEAYNGNTYTFAFGQTVYGGHFDNKGNLVVTKIAHIFDGSESLISLESGTVFAYDFGANMLVNSQVAQGESLSTHFVEVDSGFGWNSVTSGKFLVAGGRYFGCNPNMSLADYKTFLTNQYQANTPVKAICLLANPITLSITSQDIPTLLGENNIFSNCGDVEVTYYVDTEAIYAIRDVIDEFAMQSDWNEADNTKADYIKNKPTIPANADFSLSGLSDTDISSPSAGQVLVFDGDNWVNSDVEDNYLPNYWSLFADQNTSNTIKTLNVVSGRKISDFSVLFAVVIREGGERVSTIIPVGRFTNGIWVSLTEVDSINTQRWYEVKYVDDEHITVQCSTNATGSEVYIYGLGTAATYS